MGDMIKAPWSSDGNTVRDSQGRACAHTLGYINGQAEFRATLMAASPEMYEALQKAIEWFGPMLNDTPQDRAIAKLMRDALTKAEGH